jgi:hypothetical protein
VSRDLLPKLPPTQALVFSFLAFGVAFPARLIGAFVFGRFGDRAGRKFSFLRSIAIVGGTTCLTGLLPGYAQLGIAAPVLLVVLRIAQGIGIGGEFGGTSSLLAEFGAELQGTLDVSGESRYSLGRHGGKGRDAGFEQVLRNHRLANRDAALRGHPNSSALSPTFTRDGLSLVGPLRSTHSQCCPSRTPVATPISNIFARALRRALSTLFLSCGR